MPTSSFNKLLATTIVILAATGATADAASIKLNIGSGATRNNFDVNQMQTIPQGPAQAAPSSSARLCLPETVTRKVAFYRNPELSPSQQNSLRAKAKAEWESSVMAHYGYSYSSLAAAVNVQSKMEYTNMWWMTVSARPCKR